MNDRSHLLTEQRLAASMHLDDMPIEAAIDLMNQQDEIAVRAVATQRTAIASAVRLIVAALQNSGRLFYVGAGTSGRLGVLDASECPPTFRTNPEMIQGIIAGGNDAMFRAVEGAEDSSDAGENALREKSLNEKDVVVGIAAGGTTPFVHGALQYAKSVAAKTIFLSCVQPFAGETPVDVVIRPLTGPEVLTGSTRLKAGTATKLVLNRLSTLTMVQLGKVYENLMVDLKASNEKLRDRSARIIAMLTSVDKSTALELLQKADGHVKVAIVMHKKNVDVMTAIQMLEKHSGQLRAAIGDQ